MRPSPPPQAPSSTTSSTCATSSASRRRSRATGCGRASCACGGCGSCAGSRTRRAPTRLGMAPKRFEKELLTAHAKIADEIRAVAAGTWCESTKGVSLLRAYEEGLLDPDGKALRELREHARTCPACRRAMKAVEGIVPLLLPPAPVLLAASAPPDAGSVDRKWHALGAARRAALELWYTVAGSPAGASAVQAGGEGGTAATTGGLSLLGIAGGKAVVACLTAGAVGTCLTVAALDPPSSAHRRHERHHARHHVVARSATPAPRTTAAAPARASCRARRAARRRRWPTPRRRASATRGSWRGLPGHRPRPGRRARRPAQRSPREASSRGRASSRSRPEERRPRRARARRAVVPAAARARRRPSRRAASSRREGSRSDRAIHHRRVREMRRWALASLAATLSLAGSAGDAFASGYANAVLADNPQLYWRLGERREHRHRHRPRRPLRRHVHEVESRERHVATTNREPRAVRTPGGPRRRPGLPDEHLCRDATPPRVRHRSDRVLDAQHVHRARSLAARQREHALARERSAAIDGLLVAERSGIRLLRRFAEHAGLHQRNPRRLWRNDLLLRLDAGRAGLAPLRRPLDEHNDRALARRPAVRLDQHLLRPDVPSRRTDPHRQRRPCGSDHGRDVGARRRGGLRGPAAGEDCRALRGAIRAHRHSATDDP